MIWLQLSTCWLTHHNDWSRWFANSSPSPVCCPGFSFICGVAKEGNNWMRMWKIFCKVTYWAWCFQSISTGSQYVTLDNKIKYRSLASFSFGNPTNRTVTEYVGTTNTKPPGPVIMIDQSEILSCSQARFITLFFGGAHLCCAFYQPATANCTNLVQKRQFPELNRHILTFSPINVTVWSHILCALVVMLQWLLLNWALSSF